MDKSEKMLEVRNLKVYFSSSNGLLFGKKTITKAVDDISFDIYKGETFGLVGESGCGKSTTGKAIMQLVEKTSGTIILDGEELSNDGKITNIASKVQMVFQDPYSSLDPRYTVYASIKEPMVINHYASKDQIRERVKMLIGEVGLREDQIHKYPHEFSGGQRQRIGIARALALNPEFLICDEPVSALDVSIQAQVLNLMQDLQQKYGLTYLFISHNLSVIKYLCNRIAVMYLGHIVEMAEKDELFNNPMHPYTRELLKAIPVPDPDYPYDGTGIKGDVPSPSNPPSGCVFHTRCSCCKENCGRDIPHLVEISSGHFVACLDCTK